MHSESFEKRHEEAMRVWESFAYEPMIDATLSILLKHGAIKYTHYFNLLSKAWEMLIEEPT